MFRVFATLSISPSIPVTVFSHELISCHTVRRPEELHSESGLELLISNSVTVLGSPSEKAYQIKPEERKVWGCMGIPGVIITPDPVGRERIATSGDPEHVEIRAVFAPMFPEPWHRGWTGRCAADSS